MLLLELYITPVIKQVTKLFCLSACSTTGHVPDVRLPVQYCQPRRLRSRFDNSHFNSIPMPALCTISCRLVHGHSNVKFHTLDSAVALNLCGEHSCTLLTMEAVAN